MRFGVFPDYYTTQHAHALKKAKRSGHAERSEERVVRRSAPTSAIQPARMPETPKPSAAAMPSAVEKGSSGRGSPPTTAIQLARAPKKAKPSATARPIAAEKEGSGGVPRLRHNTARPRAELSQAQWRSGAKRRKRFRGFPLTATLHASLFVRDLATIVP